jgi:SAM-dependent methyltransferase
MANFLPLKRSILFCLNKLIEEYDLRSDFLDVGCGIGDVSAFLAEKGWRGRAIDVSADAIEKARQNLTRFPSVELEKKDFLEASGTYNAVFLLDILEHMPEDGNALRKLTTLIADGGHAVIAVPSNPRYWKWDDDFYGHVRRYTAKGIKKKLEDAGLETVAIWDFTFPVFWAMRQVYSKIARSPKEAIKPEALQSRTQKSGMKPEWQNSFWVNWIGKISFFWDWVYRVQFKFFKHKTRWGHEMIILAKKRETVTTHG